MRTTPVTLLCSTLALLACASAFGGTIYKWVDEKGVTHYSDQPHPDATTVELKSAQTYQSTGVAPGSQRSTSSPPQKPPAYSHCELSRPENDEVFLNTSTVTASVRLDPELRGGDRVTLALDGKRLTDQPPSASSFVLTQIARGSHSLAVVVEDSSGKTLCASPTVTFHVRQPSTQAPNRANRPRF
jgi:hypothetical protein